MTITELRPIDLQIINGGTKTDYNNGRNIGAEIREILQKYPLFLFFWWKKRTNIRFAYHKECAVMEFL